VIERRSGAHFAVKPARAFCVPAVLPIPSDTLVYLRHQTPCRHRKIPAPFHRRKQNARHGFTRRISLGLNAAILVENKRFSSKTS